MAHCIDLVMGAQYLQLGPWLVMESLSRISEGDMNNVAGFYKLRSVIDFYHSIKLTIFNSEQIDL